MKSVKIYYVRDDLKIYSVYSGLKIKIIKSAKNS